MKSAAVVISALFATVTAVRIGDYDLDDSNNALVTSNSDINIDSRSENESDIEYNQGLAQTQTKRDIIDADGDGVEDNVHKKQTELDRFRMKVFGPEIDDLHNTHNGELPGHVRAGEATRPADPPRPDYSASLAAKAASQAQAAS